MVVKRFLRFYRSAEKLNGYIDGLMERLAMQSGLDGVGGCERYAERLMLLIEDKERLSRLWARLNGVVEGLTDADRFTLFKYADTRGGTKDGAEGREIHRAVVKFTRRAFNVLNGVGAESDLQLVNKYYCLMAPDLPK